MDINDIRKHIIGKAEGMWRGQDLQLAPAHSIIDSGYKEVKVLILEEWMIAA